MPYKDKEQARAFWRRRNATPKRKTYMKGYGKKWRGTEQGRTCHDTAFAKWAAKPEVRAYRAKERREERLVNGEHVRERELAKKIGNRIAIAGRAPGDFCEICGNTSRRIVFDHCHQRGHFRGWICLNCNTALGMAGDSIQTLRKMIAYLQRTKHGTGTQHILPGL